MAKGDGKPGGSQETAQQDQQAAQQREQVAAQERAAQERQQEQQRAAEAQQQQQQETTDQQRGPGDGDRANALAADPSTEQVTQPSAPAPAEGQRIREEAREEVEDRGVVTLAEAMTVDDRAAVQYDDTGQLVNADGKKIALAADATDPDVGWTVQQAGSHVDADERVPYPGGPSGTPDQTVHPDELPDPVAALRAGLLPQNAGVLNVDPDKFEGKKSLEA